MSLTVKGKTPVMSNIGCNIAKQKNKKKNKISGEEKYAVKFKASFLMYELPEVVRVVFVFPSRQVSSFQILLRSSEGG